MTDLDQFDDVVARVRDGYDRSAFRPGAEPPARRRSPLAVSALAVTAGVTAVAIASFTGSPGSGTDLAWSATPSTPTSAEQNEVDVVCREGFADSFAAVYPIEDSEGRALPDPGPSGSVDALLAMELRGDYGLAIYSGEENGVAETLMCLTNVGVDGEIGVLAMSGGPSQAEPASVPVEVLGGSTTDYDDFDVAYGRVDESVATVELAAGPTTVQASVTDGWFIAFWPHSDDAVTGSATNEAGATIWTGSVLGQVADPSDPTD